MAVAVQDRGRAQKKEGALGGSFRRAWRFSHVLFVSVLSLVIVLVAARAALPFVLRGAINRRLDRIPGYQGRVEDVHVALWRGAYVLSGVEIVKRNGSRSRPFFSAREIDFWLAWRELLHRRILANITVDQASVNFVKAGQPPSPSASKAGGPSPPREESQLDADRRWQDTVKSIFPLDITYVKITDSRVHYVDEAANPKVDIYINNLQALATGLRNRPEDTPAKKFPASLTLDGDSIGHGHLQVTCQAEPLAPQPHFELALRLENVSL